MAEIKTASKKTLTELVTMVSGSMQFRIEVAPNKEAPLYEFFGQSEMEADLEGLEADVREPKTIRTNDKVTTLKTSDLIFILISGRASIVREPHDGFLFTQNYVKLSPRESVDPKYLAYLINEDTGIKHQLANGQQGTTFLKFTINQISNLNFPIFPNLDKQKIIGELYFNQLKLSAIKKRIAELETLLTLNKIKEAQKW